MQNINCNRCGTDNPSTSKFCSGCGYELSKLITEECGNLHPNSSRNKDVINRMNIVLKIGGVLLPLLIFFCIQYFFFRTPSVPSIDKVMVEAADEMNNACPFMLDADTRLDNTIAYPGKIFQYNHTLVNVEAELIDTIKLKEIIEPLAINLAKTNPQMKFQRDNNVILNYLYKDKYGVYLCMISITPAMYKGK